MLYGEVMAVYFSNHTKHITTLWGEMENFLCAFAKYIKVTISFRHVRPSVCPHGTTRFPLDRFS